jgi:hypothetical protein
MWINKLCPTLCVTFRMYRRLENPFYFTVKSNPYNFI